MFTIASTARQTFETGFVWRSDDNHTIIRGRFWANEESSYKVRFRVDSVEVFGFQTFVGGGEDSFLELSSSVARTEEDVIALGEAVVLDLVGKLSNRFESAKAEVDEKWWW